jgi:hypothetical protein
LTSSGDSQVILVKRYNKAAIHREQAKPDREIVKSITLRPMVLKSQNLRTPKMRELSIIFVLTTFTENIIITTKLPAQQKQV